jgi:hypothetical protein
LREIKRRQEAAEAQERARREQEEAERLAALAAAQPKQPEAVPTDRPDSGTPAAEERPGMYRFSKVLFRYLVYTGVCCNEFALFL